MSPVALPRFTTEVHVRATPEQVWERLTDWPAHARWIPFTSVRVLTGSGAGVGARFVARTALGPVGFDDVMEVTAWAPPVGALPGRCEVVKRGRVMLGGTVFEIRAGLGEGTSIVLWSEEIAVLSPALNRPVAPVVSLAGKVLFGRALSAMKHELEAEGRARG